MPVFRRQPTSGDDPYATYLLRRGGSVVCVGVHLRDVDHRHQVTAGLAVVATLEQAQDHLPPHFR